jgi:hypothetical protein
MGKEGKDSRLCRDKTDAEENAERRKRQENKEREKRTS